MLPHAHRTFVDAQYAKLTTERPPRLTTPTMVDVQLRNCLSPRSLGQSEGSIHILERPEFLYNTIQDKTSSIYSTVAIQYRCVADRQTDRQTETWLWHILR